jgi:hypothetical protein
MLKLRQFGAHARLSPGELRIPRVPSRITLRRFYISICT